MGALIAILLCVLCAGSVFAQTLAAPSALSATVYSKSQVNLVWNDPNPTGGGAQETGYVVERAKGSQAVWSEASITGVNVTSWPQQSLAAGTTYFFRVRAFVTSGGVTTYSAYSPVASATTQSTAFPDPPMGLLASASSDTQIKVTWQNQASNATGYNVQQQLGANSWLTIGTAPANANYFLVGGLSANTSFTFRVTAVNGTGESPPSNLASATTRSAATDTVPPSGTVVINSGVSAVASPAVTLTLSASDATGVTGYFVSSTSTTPAASAAGWTPVASTTSLGTSTSFTLASGTGTKTVFAWFKDAAGNVSATASASVLLDQTPPVDGSVNASAISTSQVNISWIGYSDANSGLNTASYKVVSSTSGTPADCNSGTVVFSGSGSSASHTGLTANTQYFYRVCVSDMVGNGSSGAIASATTQTGGGGNGNNATGIKLNSDAPYTTTLNVTANIGMTDPAGVVAYWLSSNSNPPTASSTGWVGVTQTTIYSGNIPVTLAAVDGTRTMYVWFKNASGVVSATYSDSIMLDRVAPANGTVSATPALGKVTVGWSGYTDTGSGLATTGTYTVVTATGAAPASCSTGTTIYTGTGTTFDHTTAVGGTVNYYRVCATDKAGNVSTGSTASATPLSNQPPVAKAGPDQFGLVGTTVYFDASGSTDPDGTIASYAFTFGDGGSVPAGSASLVGHVYSSAGTYTLTLTVTDNQGLTSTSTASVTIRAGTASSGTYSSARQLGGTGVEVGYDVAFDASGNIVMVGTFQNTVNFGGGNLTSAGAADIYIAKYTSAGTHICSLAIGGAGDERVSSVAVDASGNIVIGGSFQGTVNFGGITKTAVGSNDGFVAKYSSTCGTTALWARSFGSTTDDNVNAVAVDANGDVLMTGFFTSYSDFGGGQVLGSGPYADVVVAKYSGSTGAYQWAHTLNGSSIDTGRSLAIDAGGNVIVGGSFNQTVAADLGANPLLTSAGAGDGFLVKYSSAGTLLWAKSMGGVGEDVVFGITVDKGGNIGVTGSFENSIVFAGGASLTSSGLSDAFVARFTPMGSYLWGARIGTADVDIGYSIVADDVGNLVMTGALQSGGQQDIVVQKYSPVGTQLWSHTYGSTSNDVGYSVALDATGNVLVTGYFQSSINFGGGSMNTAGFSDSFLLKLTP